MEKIEAIEWVDATSHDEISKDEIKRRPVKYFLTPRTRYGIVLKEDEGGILIAHDIDGDSVELIAIPKGNYKRVKTKAK